MSQKKSNDFNNSPFKNLKGLSLPEKAEKVKVAAPLQRSEGVREYDFSVEMQGLGVKILPADERHAEIEHPGPVIAPAPVHPVPVEPRNDKELFLSAIQGMTTLFADEIPELEVPTATPRRMKLVEQGRLIPSERLDLHGLTRSEARRRTVHFLENAIHHGYPLVLIITGWGKHGSGEAVLREEIARYFRTEGAPLISEWSFAPKNFGGDGALLVFPRLTSPQKKPR